MLDLNLEYFSSWMLSVMTSFMEGGFRILVILLLTFFVIRFFKFGLSRLESAPHQTPRKRRNLSRRYSQTN